MAEAYKQIYFYIGIFYIIYLVGYATFLFLSVIVGSFTLYNSKKSDLLENKIADDYYIPVSIVVPAYNEVVTIVDTIKSLLTLEYTLYEIIVVDDGSKDDTSKAVIDAFNMQRINKPIEMKIPCNHVVHVFETKDQKVPITLIRKKNGGKADALNMGINASNFPYFICMDADSVLQFDSLSKIVKPIIENDNVVAVGGAIRPCNGMSIVNGRVEKYAMPKNILSCMQVLEYDRSFLASRILFDKFNGNIIISGAFGLFDKETVISVGGYDSNTMGEDMELVVKLHVFCRKFNKPYKIKYANDAICWTQAPESLKDLCKQRKRWHIGLFQTMIRHRTMLANIKFGMVGFISYMYFLLYELLSPYIELFGIVTMFLACYFGIINIPFMIWFMAFYTLYASVMSLAAFFSRSLTIDDIHITFRDVIKAIVLCAIEVFFLRIILSTVRAWSLVGYKKKKKDWGQIERKKINIG